MKAFISRKLNIVRNDLVGNPLLVNVGMRDFNN